jgi:hypothetical protein
MVRKYVLLMGKLQKEIQFTDDHAAGLYFVRVLVNDQLFKGQVLFSEIIAMTKKVDRSN